MMVKVTVRVELTEQQVQDALIEYVQNHVLVTHNDTGCIEVRSEFYGATIETQVKKRIPQ